MDKSDPSVGTTLTAGIQDISALLPLLGTEQCEQHIGSALTHGFLYVAATPMSIFGSLGMARAAFKGLMASISSHRFIGASKLQDAGFAASGTNLSLIMMDPSHRRRHLAETRLDSLLEALHIDDVERLAVVTSCSKWNVKMFLLTAVFSIIGLAPYIHLNLDKRHNLPLKTRLVFSITRVVGGFLTATSLQILIERRLVALLKNRLAFRALDAYIAAAKTPLPGGVLWDPHQTSELCLRSLEQWFRSGHVHSPYEHMRLFMGFTAIGKGAYDEKLNDIEVGTGRQASVQPVDFSRECGHDAKPSASESKDTRYHQSSIAALRQKFIEVKTQFALGSEIMWPFIILTALGIAASVVGYIGCFSVVQGSSRSRDPLIWLILESVLSIVRIALWGWIRQPRSTRSFA
ncbi:hypothetical protein FPV67DRAFT_158337 [Lyophyllum atratum]|nr:hypothetical protein FPV67DRAFT_158337 [Lyophyllum atratum]